MDADFLEPQRAAMVGLAGLSEAVLGRTTTFDGLAVDPATPASLAVVVGAGQIYAVTALDALAYGSLDADLAHAVVKQGMMLDPLRVPLTAPTTPGYSQTFLLQAAFQEAEAGATVLPYYNSQNPSQAWAGPNNSGAQQYTRREGRVAVQVKAGAPAPTGSQPTPVPDAGWVGLAWVTVAAGQAVINASHITRIAGVQRITRKLPALGRIVGANYKVIRGATALTIDEAGLAVLDLGAWLDGVDILLPPAALAAGEPIRFRFVGRYLTPRSRRALSWGRILPAPGDAMDIPSIYCGPNDSVELVSDGNSRWFWTSSKYPDAVAITAAGNQAVPNAAPHAVTFSPPGAITRSAWWIPSDPTVIRFDTFVRVRMTACVTFAYAGAGARQAYFHVNGQPASGLGMPWATSLGATGNLPVSLSLAGGATGMTDGDILQLVVYQDSGAPLLLDSAKTWVSVETVA